MSKKDEDIENLDEELEAEEEEETETEVTEEEEESDISEELQELKRTKKRFSSIERNIQTIEKRFSEQSQELNKCFFLAPLKLKKSPLKSNEKCSICGKPAMYDVSVHAKEDFPASFPANGFHLCKIHQNIEHCCLNAEVPFYFAPCDFWKMRQSCPHFSKEEYEPNPNSTDFIQNWATRCTHCRDLVGEKLLPNTTETCVVCGKPAKWGVSNAKFNLKTYLCDRHYLMKVDCSAITLSIFPATCAMLEDNSDCKLFKGAQ